MKKILFVATVARQHIMQFHLPYLKMFKEKGYTVHVAAKNDFLNKEDTIPYCDVFFQLPFSRNPLSKDNIRVFNELKAIMEKENYEIIHCHTPVGAALTRLAARTYNKNHPNDPSQVIYTAHGFHFFKGAPLQNWLLYYPVEKYLSKDTDKLITINTEDYKRAKEHFKAKKTYYVKGVGVDITRFKPHEDKRIQEQLKNDLNIPKDAKVILSVGELNKNKNHQKILEALATIPHDNIYYVIAGLGSMKAALEKFAVEHQIHLLCLGYRKDVPELMGMANLYAFPSIREGLSLSLMEAMASHMGILASDIRGNNDLIQHQENGELFHLKISNEELGQQIKHLLEDTSTNQEYANKSREKVKEYSLAVILPEMGKIYQERV